MEGKREKEARDSIIVAVDGRRQGDGKDATAACFPSPADLLSLSLSPLFSGSDQGSSLTDEAQTETLQAVLLCMCVRESVSVHGFN